MKKLLVHNPSYRALLISFKEWLDIMGYEKRTVYGWPLHLQEFFHWMEQHHIYRIDHITTAHIQRYYDYLKTRPNQKRGGGISNSYLNKHQIVLRKFKEYLEKHQAIKLTLGLRSEKMHQQEKLNILTIEEVKELFDTTQNIMCERKSMRYQTLLVLLYSCGLRRSEVIAVDTRDINFDTQLLHVRKGKNFKERLIPLNKHSLEILENFFK